MLAWCAMVALAAPPADKAKKGDPKTEVVIEVVPNVIEGQVRVFMPGRDGDELFVDEWTAGPLPVQTTLAEGFHHFRIEGKAGRQIIEAYVTPVVDKVIDLDLANPPTQATAPEPAPLLLD